MRHLDGRMLHLNCESDLTAPGQVRRLRGWGMPRRGSARKGDLYLRFNVRFPTSPVAGEQAKLLQQLLPKAARPSAKPAPGERVYRLEDVETGESDDGDGEWGV